MLTIGSAFSASAGPAEGASDIEAYVLGTGGAGIPAAHVTVWQCAYDNRTGLYKNLKPVSNNTTLTIGCGFPGVEPGFYNVTAERDGNTGYSVVESVPGAGVKNAYVVIDEHKATPRAAPRFLRHGGLPLPPMPPQMPGGPPSAAQLTPSAPAWLEPIPRAGSYGHSYNITSTYYVTQPNGTYVLASDVKYDDSVKGIVTADDYFTIKKGEDGYWHYVNFYTGNLSGKAGIDKPAFSDSGGVYEGPPADRSVPLYLPYVPRPGYMDPTIELSSIAGIVTNRSGSGVPGANITVYQCAYDRFNGEYLDLGMVPNPANPQLSRDERDSIAGIYTIPYLPPGTYRVVAEKDGHSASRIVQADPKKGTSTADIIIDIKA